MEGFLWANRIVSLSCALQNRPLVVKRMCNSLAVAHFKSQSYISTNWIFFQIAQFRRGCIRFAIDRCDLLFQILLQCNFDFLLPLRIRTIIVRNSNGHKRLALDFFSPARPNRRIFFNAFNYLEESNWWHISIRILCILVEVKQRKLFIK